MAKEELIEIVKELTSAKNVKPIRIINWRFADGSGNKFYIECENGEAYELNENRGFSCNYIQKIVNWGKYYSIRKIAKKDLINIKNGIYNLLNKMVSVIIKEIIEL